MIRFPGPDSSLVPKLSALLLIAGCGVQPGTQPGTQPGADPSSGPPTAYPTARTDRPTTRPTSTGVVPTNPSSLAARERQALPARGGREREPKPAPRSDGVVEGV